MSGDSCDFDSAVGVDFVGVDMVGTGAGGRNRKRRSSEQMAADTLQEHEHKLARAIKKLDQHRALLDQRVARAMAEHNRERKRADDRVKVLVGAYILDTLRRGHHVDLQDANDLLAAMDAFLLRPAERDALLGVEGQGSAAWQRVLGINSD